MSSTAQAEVTAAAAPAKQPAQQTQAATTLASVAKPASSAQQQQSQQTSAAAPSSGSSNSGSSSSGGSVLAAITKQGMQQPKNDGSISTSPGNPNKVSVSNKSGKDMLYVCWGSAGSWVNANAPIIAQPISSGGSSTLYFANTASGAQGGACCPVFADTQMKNGQLVETWVEATFNQYGTVDVSREVTMSGTTVQVTSGQCVSNMSQCVFECTNGQDTCGAAGTYALKNPGTDCNGDTMNGGCKISGNGMSVTVG